MNKAAKNPIDLIFDNIYIELNSFLESSNVLVKIEGFSIGGSIKIKSALKMIERLEMKGRINTGDTLIESSSGNLGIALSIICAIKGYKFICVSDPNMSLYAEKKIKAYGAEIIKVTEKDKNGGYLETRINYIKKRIKKENLVWVNQYENIDNVDAHFSKTAPSILKDIGKIDYLFIGAGTTGTLSGVSRYFKKYSPDTKIIAVDSVGSVTFGEKPSRRLIPGLGTSKKPPISVLSKFDDILYIEEIETVKMCRDLAKKGMLFGGSTGTVLSAIKIYENKIRKNSTVVCISPDCGNNYLDTIYNDEWIEMNFKEKK